MTTSNMQYLRRLFPEEKISIHEPVRVPKSLVEFLWDVLIGWWKSDLRFNKLGFNTPSETFFAVYEQISEGTFTEVFGSLNNDVEKLRLARAKIRSFCRHHQDKMTSNGWPSFFLYTERDEPVSEDKGNLFVLFVGIHDDGLFLDKEKFLSNRVQFGSDHFEYTPRMIVPKL